MSNIPHPDEVAASVARVQALNDITFDVGLLGAIRTVWLHSGRPMPNRVNPYLTVIFYRMDPVIATPYLSNIDGHLAVSLGSISQGYATWIGQGFEERVYFKPCTPKAEQWLRLQVAKANGMKYRRHGDVKPDEIIYTKEP